MCGVSRRRLLKWSASASAVAFGSVSSGLAAEKPIETTEELMSALASAKGGDTIWIMPGSTFPNLQLTNLAYGTTLTIDTTTRDRVTLPRINKLAIDGCSNLHFKNVRFDEIVENVTVGWDQCVAIHNCSKISIDSCEFDGKAALADNDEAQLYSGTGVGRAIELINSTGISVSNCNFMWWAECFSVSECHDVTIHNNKMLYTSNNGVIVIGGSGYRITNNDIGDFRVSPLSGLHPDAIQFGTPGLRIPVSDILIDGNTIYTGDEGNQDMQSIFGRNEAFDREHAGRGMFYKNVTITNNEIRAKLMNAIDWGAAENIRIENNDVQPWGQKPWPRDQLRRPMIELARESVDVSIQNNIGKLLERMPRWIIRNNKDPYR